MKAPVLLFAILCVGIMSCGTDHDLEYAQSTQAVCGVLGSPPCADAGTTCTPTLQNPRACDDAGVVDSGVLPDSGIPPTECQLLGMAGSPEYDCAEGAAAQTLSQGLGFGSLSTLGYSYSTTNGGLATYCRHRESVSQYIHPTLVAPTVSNVTRYSPWLWRNGCGDSSRSNAGWSSHACDPNVSSTCTAFAPTATSVWTGNCHWNWSDPCPSNWNRFFPMQWRCIYNDPTTTPNPIQATQLAQTNCPLSSVSGYTNIWCLSCGATVDSNDYSQGYCSRTANTAWVSHNVQTSYAYEDLHNTAKSGAKFPLSEGQQLYEQAVNPPASPDCFVVYRAASGDYVLYKRR